MSQYMAPDQGLHCLPFIEMKNHPVSILYKSIASRYRPVSYPDGPITARCRFIKNASWAFTTIFNKTDGIGRSCWEGWIETMRKFARRDVPIFRVDAVLYYTKPV